VKFISVRFAVMYILVLGLPACAPTYKELFPTLADGKYDSEFPYRGCSKQLEEIAESVQMVSGITYYRNFSFAESEQMIPAGVTPELLASRLKKTTIFTNQLSGTATVISSSERRVVLLTCAHVVSFPDTLYAFYPGPDHKPGKYLRAMAIKEKQSLYIAVFPEGGDVDIIAIDKELDLALLGKTFIEAPFPPIRAFPYPAGKARELEWGSFVYLFGYPSGKKMITKAIVSNPNKDRTGMFYVDAVFNRGFSGGIALAVRDGVPNFELAGIMRLMLGHTSYVLSPPPDDEGGTYDTSTPYQGEIFVQKHTDIDYGIAQAIPIEAIQEFITARHDELQRRGYSVKLGTPPAIQ
jgi:hypothetical protein